MIRKYLTYPGTWLAVALWVAVALVAVSAQSQDKAMAWLPADRGIPQTLVIKAAVPDTALVCMEPPTGTVICRTVGVFREWMADSTANRIKK